MKTDQYKFMITTHIVLLRMGTVSDKSCKRTRNPLFVFNNNFPKIVPFMRWCEKLWYSPPGHR